MNQLWQKIKGNKIILGFLIFDLLAIAFLIALPIIDSFNTATVSIQVVPLDSKITINGKTYENNNTYNILPSSNAKIEISHDGLETISYTQDLNNNTTTNIVKYLTGKDQDFSYYEYKDHEKDLRQLINISSIISNDEKLAKFTTAYKKKMAIFEKLPFTYANYDAEYNYTEYIVDRSKACQKILCLKITDINGNNEENAKRLIKDNGFSPSDYEYDYEYKPVTEFKSDV